MITQSSSSVNVNWSIIESTCYQ